MDRSIGTNIDLDLDNIEFGTSPIGATKPDIELPSTFDENRAESESNLEPNIERDTSILDLDLDTNIIVGSPSSNKSESRDKRGRPTKIKSNKRGRPRRIKR